MAFCGSEMQRSHAILQRTSLDDELPLFLNNIKHIVNCEGYFKLMMFLLSLAWWQYFIQKKLTVVPSNFFHYLSHGIQVDPSVTQQIY